MLDVLEHLLNPNNLLKEVFRVTSKYVIISVPNFNSLPSRIQVLLGKIPENNRHHQGHIYWFNYYVLRDLLDKSNIKINMIVINSLWEDKPVVGFIFKYLANKLPNIFGLSFIVLGEK